MRIRALGVALTGAAMFGLAGSSDAPLATARVSGAIAGTDVQSVDLSLDPDRLEALFGAESELAAARLMEEALVVQAEGDGPAELVLLGYRLIDGRPMATFESAPFQVALGTQARVADLGGLPAPDFYGDAATVDRDGIATAGPVSAARGAADPVRLITTGVSNMPAAWYQREVFYLIAVPADENLRTAAMATPVVVFGAEAVRLETASTAPGGAGGGVTDVQEILRRFAATEQKCRGWVNDYTLYLNVEGFVIPQYYEAYQGGPECRQVAYTEVAERWGAETNMESPGWTHEHAQGLDMLGGALNQELSREGVPGIGQGAQMATSLMAEFVRAGAEIDADTLMVDDVRERSADRSDFVRRARLVGVETVDGRRALHVRAEGLQDIELDRPPGSTDFTLLAASLWLDFEYSVPLRLQFELEAREGDKVRLLTLELLNQDYVPIPVASEARRIFVPSRQVMRIRGLTEALSEKDRAELQAAVAEVKKLEAQMDQMPAAARGMIQGQIDRLKRMTGEEGESVAEATIDLIHAVVNEGPPYPGGEGQFRLQSVWFPGAMTMAEWEGSGLRFLPTEIGFTGKEPSGTVGQLTVSNIEWDPYEVPATSITLAGLRGIGTVRWSYTRRDGTIVPEEYVEYEEPTVVQIHTLTFTEAKGHARSESTEGWFVVGHMPCSPMPRGIDPGQLASFRDDDMYGGPEIWTSGMKAQDMWDPDICRKALQEAPEAFR